MVGGQETERSSDRTRERDQIEAGVEKLEVRGEYFRSI